MRYKILLEGPVLTQSGYGEHARLVLRSLRDREDVLDIYVSPLNWGSTNWILGNKEERNWIDSLVNKEYDPKDANFFDIHVHVGIPNEFQRKGKYAVHVTAGIETTKVAKKWIENSHQMDAIVVPSEFAKWAFENTKHPFDVEGGGVQEVACGAPVKVVPYPHRTLELDPEFDIELKDDFNFLIVAQWSIRKNLENTIRWFAEEFKDQEVGLVIKTSLAKNSVIDRLNTIRKLNELIDDVGEGCLCSIYLLHGNMSKKELNSLYQHPKIKALVSATHGEGYGLPLFEASYNGLPVVAPGWSGHLDFLYGPIKGKNGKVRKKPLFARVDYVLAPVQKEAVWSDIIIASSMWCFPNKVDFKKKLRAMHQNNGMYKSWAKILKDNILKNHSEEAIKKRMVEAVLPSNLVHEPDYIFVSDMFAGQYSGGAELSLQTVMQSSPSKHVGAVNSELLNEDIFKMHKSKKWIFGNTSRMSAESFELVKKYDIQYSFLEFDYKFCKHRNPALYEMVEGEACKYESTDQGKMMLEFCNNASAVFFMSEKQMAIHKASLPDIRSDNFHVLSSLFDKDFFRYVDLLRDKYKNKKKTKWLVMGSTSWVKGVQESEDWCIQNSLEYEVVDGLKPEEFLEKLAQAKGLCFKPGGLDTCPRLVIEAKLLGCELELNDNVQHATESWFESTAPNSIVEHLLSRPAFFWENAFEE